MKRALILLLAPTLASAQPADGDPTPATSSTTPAPPATTPIEVVAPPVTPSPAPIAAIAPAPPPHLLFADPGHHPLEVDLELFGTGAYTTYGGSSLSEFRLDRGELGTMVGLGMYLGAELRLESIRSAAEGGALGVDGDSLVVRVKRAQVFGEYTIDAITLHGALGITPDPWITALETDDPIRPLTATASERTLGWPTSDLAALGRVAYGPVRLSVAAGNGEGLQYPERNNGKTTTAVIEAVPLDLATARVRVAAVARDGSVGPARVRDRRFGGGATLWTPLVSVGGELVQAYGIADRGDLEALSLAGWAEVRPIDKLALVGRFTTVGYANGGGRASSFGGAVAVEPWREKQAYARLWLALDRTTDSGGAMPIPGSLSGDATTLMIIASTTAPFTVDR